MKSIEDKIKSDVLLLPDEFTTGILLTLYDFSDNTVITFLRNSLSILAIRMLTNDGHDLEDEDTFIAYHRKVIACLLESLDVESE